MKTFCFTISITLSLALAISAQDAPTTFSALGMPAQRTVDIAFNRYYDPQGIENILQELHENFPNLTKLYSIGDSYEGRPIWCLEVTNFEQGDAERKPGMYIDGNIHGNEVQAAEVVLYTAWFLCESFGRNEKVDALLRDRVFYLIPTINPDGRYHWFHEAHTAHSSRTGLVPLDNDRDGLVDEDPAEDLNGDGHISLMRKRDPMGRHKAHPDYPEYLMVAAAPDEPGEYTLLGEEGIDNDGDGRVNEDGLGGYDSNRNWPYDWQPNYVQYGAHDFPFSLPNANAVKEFVIARPNIAAMQSYHNYGGMILRAPGRESGVFDNADDRVAQNIAAKGELMLPEYRSMIIYRDLYTVWGGEIDWFYGGEGILSFTNELWTLKNMFRQDRQDEKARVEFAKYLLLEQGVVKWEEYDHPTYGLIEIGGFTKEHYRVPPSFLLEEECHRNMAFTLYHADQMPLLEFGEIQIEELGENLHKVWVEVRNHRMIPTRLNWDVRNSISAPDLVTLEGEGIEVISSGRIQNRYFGEVEPIQIRPARVPLNTIKGLESEWIQFIVTGSGTAIVRVDSIKGGVVERDVDL